MKRRDYFILFLSALILILLSGLIRHAPGYMDEAYYFQGGVRLYEGEGFTEEILWNYLDDPDGLPHPSHLYWMPLPSIVSYIGMVLSQSPSYSAGRLMFVLLAALISPFTAWFSWQLRKDRFLSMMAGVLGIFSGFYFAYYAAVESFVIYMLLGAGFLFGAFFANADCKSRPMIQALGLGVLAGLMHLTRTDGIIWAGGLVVYYLMRVIKDQKTEPPKKMVLYVVQAAVGLAAYFLVMSPWYVRNYHLFGSLTPPGSSRMFWLTEYDQTFIANPAWLTFNSWRAAGIQQIVQDRLAAMGTNLQSFLGVQSEIILFPFILIGAWKMRKEQVVQFSAIMWLGLLILMSIVFPYAGARGGFFHSGSAYQILFWSLAVIGFDDGLRWLSGKRKWNFVQARKVLGIGLLALCALVTLFLFAQRVVGVEDPGVGWGKTWTDNQNLDTYLMQAVDIGEHAPIMINDPPSYYAATRRPSLVIPYGDEDILLSTAKRYGVDAIILQVNHPAGLNKLYQTPENFSQFEVLGRYEDALILGVNP